MPDTPSGKTSASPLDPSERPWPWLEQNDTLPRPGRGRSRIRALDRPPSDYTQADSPIPVIVHLSWVDGWEADMPAAAEAWTRDAVRIRWLDFDKQRSDWVPADTVRRTASP
jgi:hypothetical protein